MIWFFLACESPQEQPQKPTEEIVEEALPSTEAPYLLDTEQQTQSIDLSILEVDLNTLFTQVFSLHPQTILDHYQNILTSADEGCPQWYINEDNTTYWYDYCYTDTGYTFDGYGTAPFEVDEVDAGGTVWSGLNLWGVGSIQAPDGTRITTNGWLTSRTGSHENGTLVHYVSITEGFSLSPSEIEWEEDTPALSIYAVHNPIGHRNIVLNGLFSMENSTILLEDLQMLHLGADECNLEPTGSISMFITEIGWLDLVLDVEDLWATATDACDGCGSVFRKGVYVGDICMDFSRLLDWTDNPWE